MVEGGTPITMMTLAVDFNLIQLNRMCVFWRWLIEEGTIIVYGDDIA